MKNSLFETNSLIYLVSAVFLEDDTINDALCYNAMINFFQEEREKCIAMKYKFLLLVVVVQPIIISKRFVELDYEALN